MTINESLSNGTKTETIIKTERVFSLDILRIIAIFAVVMIHVSAGWVAGEEIEIDSFAFNVGNIFDSISRIGVPIFCMISGALLLNENKEYSFAKMRKSIISMGIILILWNIFYALVYNTMKFVIKGEPISIRSLIIGVINGHFHLWYLYMLIGFYVIIPFIKPLIKKDNWKKVFYFVLIAIAIQMGVHLLDAGFAFFTDKKLATLLIDKFNLDFFKGFTVYFLTGWLIVNIPLEKSKRYIIYIFGIIGLLITIIFTRLLSIKEDIFIGDFYSNHSINVYLYSIAIFIFIFYSCKNINSLNGFVLSLSKLSFGVYLIHPFIQSIFHVFVDIENALIAIFIEWPIVISVSYLVVFVMSKIPIIKKLVRG